MLAIPGQTPAFPGVVERFEWFEAFPVVDEDHVRAPGELVDAIPDHFDAFAEVAAGERNALKRLAGFQIDPRQTRKAMLAGALPKLPVAEHQPLGEGGDLVGIGVDDFIAVNPRLLGGKSRREAQQNGDQRQSKHVR